MAESDIAIIPQDQTVSDRIVVVTESDRLRGYKFDAVRKYRTRRTYRPTKHSVPSGAAITDHVSTDPISFQLVGLLTPYNAADVSGFASLLFGAFASDNVVTDAIADSADTELEATRRKRDQLIQFADEKTLLTVMGNEFQHANMIITSIDDPRTVGLGDAYELTISFRQIRIPVNVARIAPLISDDADFLGGGDVQDVGQ